MKKDFIRGNLNSALAYLRILEGNVFFANIMKCAITRVKFPPKRLYFTGTCHINLFLASCQVGKGITEKMNKCLEATTDSEMKFVLRIIKSLSLQITLMTKKTIKGY